MAKYAQGYGRRNSDNKNLIILISSIVGVIALAIVAVILYNAFGGGSKAKTLKDYTDYEITDYSQVLDQEEGNYVVYVYDSSQTSTADSVAITYLEKYDKGNVNVKLYVIDYHMWNLDAYQSSDSNYSTIEKNHTAIDNEFESVNGYEPEVGNLFAVLNNNILDKSTQIVTSQVTQGSRTSVADLLKKLYKNENWLEYNKQ